jgi:Cu+-exporting ATPase
MAVDPICGMTVDAATTPYRSVVGGQTYYFCSAACQKKFLANPGKISPDSHRM